MILPESNQIILISEEQPSSYIFHQAHSSEGDHHSTMADDSNVVEHLLLDVRIEEDEGTRRSRLKIALVTQWVFAILLIALVAVIAIIFPPWSPKARNSDMFQTSWSLIWSSLMLTHILLLLSMSHIRLLNGQPPKILFHCQRTVRSLNTIWFFCGIKPLFWDAPYNDNAISLARSLWWTQAGFFLIPLFIYLLICLCLPCILVVLNRVRTPSPNELPTPDEILSKLEVKRYDELLELLRREFGAHEVELRSSASLFQDVINRNPIVEALTTAAGGPLSSNGGGTNNRSGAVLEQPRQEDQSPLLNAARQRLKIERSCPICMVDFDKGDEVMVMPCDRRHFFHVECVKLWLRNSQFCPICRANITTLLSENCTSPVSTTTTAYEERRQTPQHRTPNASEDLSLRLHISDVEMQTGYTHNP